MQKTLKVKEAVEHGKKIGLFKTRKELSKNIFTDCSPDSARVRLNKFENGSSLRIDRATVERICDNTGVTPNFLFGWNDPVALNEE